MTETSPLTTRRSPLRILTVANVPPDPNSGAAGTVYYTNAALRELGHQVDEIWADQLGPRRIAHGNLHSLLEQPRAYRREVQKAVSQTTYDAVIMSQPQAYLAAKSLRQQGFRGVIINRSHGLELRVDSVLPFWHKKLQIPETRFPRSLLTPLMRRLLHRQWDQIVKLVDAIVVPCQMDRNHLTQRYDVDNDSIRTIHHGVTQSILGTTVPPITTTRQKAILHVGQFSFFKGPHLVAMIMNQLLERSPDISFTWVSSAEGCKQAAALISPGHRSRVTFIGWTSQERLVSIFDQHGLFLFPSICEGAAKSSLEAMARGLCVIGSDDSGMRDYIENGVNGFLCPVGNIDDFTNTLEKASSHLDIGAISAAARKYSTQKTWTECARQFQELINHILDQKTKTT